MTPLLEARHLVKSLGGRRVVDGVDLECHGGQILGLLGPNGAGKTTTLRMLYGFLKPDGGTIRFDGLDAGADLGHVKRYLGVCTQDDTFDADFSVEQNLTIAARYFRPGVPALRRRVDELLDRFGLRAYATMRPETLSGGFKRRLMIARALVHRPRLLFLDEPTTGLDVQSRTAMWDEVARLAGDDGVTVFLTTQYLEEADALADRVGIIDHGHLVAEGTPTQLKAQIGLPTVEAIPRDTAARDAVARVLSRFGEPAGASPKGVSVRLRGGEADLADVVRALDAENISVEHLQLHAPSLDDVFLAKTGRSLEGAGDEEEEDADVARRREEVVAA
jgi:ABC-type multidrug transport system ATPase subunit